MMINTDYKIKALKYLMNKECLSERYYSLIDYKDILLTLKCKNKSDIEKLSDSQLLEIGFKDNETIKLLRKFLIMYEPNPSKFKEIDQLRLSMNEKFSYKELYFLPGVKKTRASLYYKAGYKSLLDIANSSEEEILKKTSKTIKKYNLECIVPLGKEVRTHIAVSKAFCDK